MKNINGMWKWKLGVACDVAWALFLLGVTIAYAWSNEWWFVLWLALTILNAMSDVRKYVNVNITNEITINDFRTPTQRKDK